jgi:excinuclease ABC subunit C
MIPDFIDKSKLPHKSGVYQFLNSKKEVIYVGKAIDLNKRVSSYFSNDVTGKTAVLVSQITFLETIVVESELEALILEANLIKKYRPIFNVKLMDDKDYLYIGITKEDFPKVITIRKQDLKGVKKYFGPFPSARTVKDTLKLLRRVFPWCSNPPGSRNKNSRACFYYHIGLCPGACVGLILKDDYNKIISRFAKFLDGKKDELIKELSIEMMNLSGNQKFEQAAKIKKMLEGIVYLTQTNRTHFYLENPNFLENETKSALEQLQGDLRLKKLPERVEGYDISNTSGKEAVGSMVVLTNGEIDKSQYRKFKIKITGRPNDVGMHMEMMRRRLKNDWPLPDLIIIDGGRGQVRGAKKELENAQIDIPIFGLAKREEWLYPPVGDIIKLPKKNLSLRLLQKLRDESHRFAITYHRKLRDTIKF